MQEAQNVKEVAKVFTQFQKGKDPVMISDQDNTLTLLEVRM